MAVPLLMIITGYVYSLSLSKQKIFHLEDSYQGSVLMKRIIRYSFPVVCLIIWEAGDPHFHVPGNMLDFVRWVLNGTSGKGSYYIPVMLQMTFLFPVVYFVVEKNREKGLLICLAVSLMYEALAWSYGMNTECYRLLAFRYVFNVAAGVFAYKGMKIQRMLSLLMMAVGAVFIALISYFHYEPRILNGNWASTNCIASMLIVPLTIWLLQNVNIRFAPLEAAGRASYHIFLVQMAYYMGYYAVLEKKINNSPVHLMTGIVVCLAAGIAFFYLEEPVQKRLIRALSK